MMAKYSLRIEVIVHGTVVVEADDEDAAEAEFYRMVELGIVNDTDPAFSSDGLEVIDHEAVSDDTELTYAA
jgi:hypothetical protein